MAQQKLADAQVPELLAVGPFLGIDATTSKYFLDQYHANDAIAVVPDRMFQGYLTAKGRVAAISSPYLSTFFGLYQLQRQGQADIYLATVNQAGVGKLQWAAIAGTPATLSAPMITNAWVNASFASQQNWTFVADGASANTPVKVDNSLTVTNWGITAPGAPTVAAGAAGVLNGTYFYIITFANASQESSGGTVSAGVTLTNQQASLTSIPVSSDAQVTTKNIYRFGGTMQDILLVGSISNATTSFTDNTADTAVTGQSLVLHRDPPQPFYDIAYFQGRIWGFGYPGTAVGQPSTTSGTSDLWFSNYEEPWGFDNVNQVLPVGRNTGGDIAIAVRPLSGILCLLKSQSFWAYWGGDNPTSDPPPFLVANVGCSAKTSAFVYNQRLFFAATDNTIRMFDGSTLTNISDGRTAGSNSSIKGILDSFSTSDFAACVGFGYDQMACFSFPTQGITFLFDIITNQWFKLPWATDRAVFNANENNFVAASRPSNPGLVDQWFAAETDLGSAITSSYVSRITDSGTPQATKQYRYAVVLAPVQSSATATVTVAVDPQTPGATYTKTQSLSIAPVSHRFSLPPTMSGTEIQLTISVTSTQKTEIQRVSVYGFIKRQFITQG